MPNLFEYIDDYCERIQPGLIQEPINLISNAAFLIAGFLILRRVHDSGLLGSPRTAWKVIGWLVIAVGVGSALFHSFALFITMLADVIPILFTNSLVSVGAVLLRFWND